MIPPALRLRGGAPSLLAVAVLALTGFVGCSRSPERDASWSAASGDVERLDSLLRRELGFAPASFSLGSRLDSLGRGLERFRDSAFESRVAAVAERLASPEGIAPVPHPSDTDLVPSLALERHRGGCTSLALAWRVLGARAGLRLDAVLLPGHATLRDSSGRFVEPLRGGLERDSVFYDSAFQLSARPGYVLRAAPRGLEAAMAVQGGLLAWKAGRSRSALDAFRTASLLAPGLPEAEGNLGLLLESTGERDSALVHLGIAVAGDPLHRAARSRLEALRRSAARW